jgi:hypothetical protein
MANATNRFANIKTYADLDERFRSAASPENLMADGERTPEEGQELYLQLLSDYNEREEEMIQENNSNDMR